MSNSLRPLDCGPPGCPVHGILQARILEWVAMPSSRKISSSPLYSERNYASTPHESTQTSSPKNTWGGVEAHIQVLLPHPLVPTSLNKSHMHCVLTMGWGCSKCPRSMSTFHPHHLYERISVGNLLRLPVANKPGTYPWICQPQGLCSGLFSGLLLRAKLCTPSPKFLC